MSFQGGTTRNDYVATANQTVFSYTFQIIADSDLVVLQNGIKQSGYTVEGAGTAGGGTITFNSGVAAGVPVSIFLSMPISRETQYTNGGDFLAEQVNEDFDRAYMAMNQIDTDAARSLVLPQTEATTPMVIPPLSTRAGKYFAFDSLGQPTTFETEPNPDVMSASYLPDFTNAVARNLKSKLEDFISVMDYGAFCNGVNDDRAAVQACFDNVPLGSTVHFPGPCAILGPLLINRKINVVGMGSAQPTLIKKAGFSGAEALKIQSSDPSETGLAGVSLHNFFINGNEQVGDGLVLVRLGSFNLMNFRVENNQGWGMVRDGLWLSVMINVVILANGRTAADGVGGVATGGGVLDQFTYRETSDLTCINFNSNKNVNHQMLWSDASAQLHRMVAFYQLGGEYGTNSADTSAHTPVCEFRAADRCGFFGVRFNSRTNALVHDILVGSSLSVGANAFSDVKNLTFTSCHTQINTDSDLGYFGVKCTPRITSIFFHNHDIRGNRGFIDLSDVVSGTGNVYLAGCETIPKNDITDPNGIISGVNLEDTFIRDGSGNPNGSTTGRPGCLYLRRAGGENTTLYVKESGVNTNTGWIGMSSAILGWNTDGTSNTILPINSNGDGSYTNGVTSLGSATKTYKNVFINEEVRVKDATIGTRVGTGGINEIFIADTVCGLRMSGGGDNNILPCRETGLASNGVTSLGSAIDKFDTVYAATGSINTSDANQKQQIEELSEAELRVALSCKGLLRKFKFNLAVENKGDDARIHVGIIAQDLKAAFEAEGLDAGEYGMFTESTGINGDGVEQTVLGVRYSELLAFIIAAI